MHLVKDTLRDSPQSRTRILLCERGEVVYVWSTEVTSTSCASASSELYGKGEGSTPSALISECIALSPDGACFAHIDATGECRRHLSRFCRSDHVAQLTQALRFRNAHSERPYVCRAAYTPQSATTLGRGMGQMEDERGSPAIGSSMARWPRSSDANQVTAAEPGKVTVTAIGGNARVELLHGASHATATFLVPLPRQEEHGYLGRRGSSSSSNLNSTYPARAGAAKERRGPLRDRTNSLISEQDDASGRGGGGVSCGSQWCWVTQHVSVANPQQCWEHAIGLCLQRAQQHQCSGTPQLKQAHAQDDCTRAETGAGTVCSVLPAPLPIVPECSSWDGIGNAIPECSQNTDIRAQLLPSDALEMARCGGFRGTIPITVEECREATYRLCTKPSSGTGNYTNDLRQLTPSEESIHVEVLLHLDGSRLVLSGDYVTIHACGRQSNQGNHQHSLGDGSVMASFEKRLAPEFFDQQLAQQCADGGGGRVQAYHTSALGILGELGAVAEHAMEMRAHFAAFSSGKRMGAKSLSPQDHQQELSADVAEQCSNSAGTFTAFADGRVRALFKDRTIVRMDSNRKVFDCLTPDAVEVTVTARAPLGLAYHVRWVLLFARWAFSSLSERRELQNNRDLAVNGAAAEMAKLRIFHVLCNGPGTAATRAAAAPPEEIRDMHTFVKEVQSANEDTLKSIQTLTKR